MPAAKDFFTKEQQKEISDAIKAAEMQTSGEIRVQLESKCTGDLLDRAAYVFGELEIQKTKLRNGVLFYLAVQDRKFAILGDAGINAKVPEGFWDDIKETMAGHFREGDFVKGLCRGIEMAGEQLKKYFPYKTDDVNELPNEISFKDDIKN